MISQIRPLRGYLNGTFQKEDQWVQMSYGMTQQKYRTGTCGSNGMTKKSVDTGDFGK